MYFRLCLIGPVIAAGIIFMPRARADETALAAIEKAIQFQKDVRAYRIKESMTDVVDGNKVVESTIEVVNPDQVHQREVVNGKLDREWFTDGKRYLIRESPEAQLKEETDDAASGIKILQGGVRLPVPKPEDVQLTGHETIAGEPVSIYTRVSKSQTVTKETLRIADKDNRLLDRSGETKGELRFTDHTIPENFFWHTSYEYDPSIKIVLPPAVKSSPSPTGAEQTTKEPKDEVERKAEAGDAEAQYAVGRRYDRGVGVTPDPVEALKWYRKAADQNYPKAQNRLGYCYENGKGVAKDLEEAAKWYRKAADQNDDGAEYNLGRCYVLGIGVPKDPVEGVKWYRKAAAQNFAMAQSALGRCYQDGQGVAKDLAEAIKWWSKAAEQDEINALYNLGRSYSAALGVPQDLVEAYKWFLRGVWQGDEDSKKGIAFLEKHMSPDQIEEARKRAFANRIRALAMESNAALTSGNYARVGDLAYPKVIEKMGGREKMIETTRQAIEDLKDHGVSILGIEVIEPREVVAMNNKLFAVVPMVVRMEGPTKKGSRKSFLIAVSEDAGKNWSFIDGNGLQDRETLTQLIPDFPAQVSLPDKQPTVFEPK